MTLRHVAPADPYIVDIPDDIRAAALAFLAAGRHGAAVGVLTRKGHDPIWAIREMDYDSDDETLREKGGATFRRIAWAVCLGDVPPEPEDE